MLYHYMRAENYTYIKGMKKTQPLYEKANVLKTGAIADVKARLSKFRLFKKAGRQPLHYSYFRFSPPVNARGGIGNPYFFFRIRQSEAQAAQIPDTWGKHWIAVPTP